MKHTKRDCRLDSLICSLPKKQTWLFSPSYRCRFEWSLQSVKYILPVIATILHLDMLLILPQLLCTFFAVGGCPWISNGVCGCQQSNSYGPHGEKEPTHPPLTPAPPRHPGPLYLSTHLTKMFWMPSAQWDKSYSYASPKVRLQWTRLSGELKARFCSCPFPKQQGSEIV